MKTSQTTESAAAEVGAWLSSDHVIALDDGKKYALRASRCTHCGQAVFPASAICPFCLADDCAMLPLHGDATLYSHTCLHSGPKRWAIPYAIGYADFPNGLRLFAKLAGPEGPLGPWQVNQAVSLVVHRELAQGEQPERFRYFLTSENK